jgi:hypothetical protein
VKQPLLIFFIAFLNAVILEESYAFVGDYNSEDRGDMAFIASIKQKNDTYELYDSSVIKLERNVASIGVAKGISSRFKLYGGLDYTLNSEIDSLGYSLDKGYSFVAGINFAFVNQRSFKVSIFGKYNNNPEEIYKDTNAGREYKISGQEGNIGLLGKYNLSRYFSIFSDVEFQILSEIEDFRSWNDNKHSIDRKDNVGTEIGFMYDDFNYFFKAWYRFGIENGFGLSIGVKLW